MLKYTGTGTLQEASIGIWGDGYSKDVTINLTKAPFNIDWKGFYPKNVNIENIGASTVKTVTLSGSSLIIIFQDPPPDADWAALADPLVPFPKPSRSFVVQFIYGTGLEE
jgi:hypothetical protein